MPATARHLRPAPLVALLSSAALIAAAGLAITSTDASADSVQLLQNPGFETGDLTGWNCSSGDKVVTSPATAGSYALAGTTTSSDFAQCAQTVSVQPNASYTLTGEVQGSYVFLGDSGTGTSDTSTWASSAGWTGLSTTFTTGASTTSVTVWVHGWYGQGTFGADTLSLTGPSATGSPSPTTTPTATPTVTSTATPTPTPTATLPGSTLNPSVAPGGNFDLSVWELQEPVGSAGSPTTIPPSELMGANGFQDAYFYTDTSDGAMTFWAPESGVTTPNSSYARSELREMNSDGSAADWSLTGTHRMDATLRVDSVTDHVAVGQIHLGSGGSSTKPLLELYYYANGDIILGTENSPDGGQTRHTVGNVPVGTKWSYTIGVSGGNTIDLTINGTTTHYDIPSSFDSYKQYFKAGSYNQSSSDSTTNGARVAFYSLTVSHN
jgi:hypothetical protein